MASNNESCEKFHPDFLRGKKQTAISKHHVESCASNHVVVSISACTSEERFWEFTAQYWAEDISSLILLSTIGTESSACNLRVFWQKAWTSYSKLAEDFRVLRCSSIGSSPKQLWLARHCGEFPGMPCSKSFDQVRESKSRTKRVTGNDVHKLHQVLLVCRAMTVVKHLFQQAIGFFRV